MMYMTIAILLEYIINCRLLILLLKAFPVPTITKNYKVAFILDGNRRYARKHNISIKEGKRRGLLNLHRILSYAEGTNIKEISIYAYSYDNYEKRSRDELESLFELARSERITRLNYSIRFFGALHKLQPAEKRMIKQIEKESRHKDRRLNVCLLYSGMMEKTPFFSRPHVLIRTGGQRRLSGFLLIHCANGCNLNFLDVMWPEFEIWQFYLVMLKYRIETRL